MGMAFAMLYSAVVELKVGLYGHFEERIDKPYKILLF